MTRPRKPKLTLRLIAEDEGGIVLDALDETLDFAEVAWLNRAAEEWPLLRRALREAIDEIEASMGGRREPTEDQVALLGRLCEAMGPREVRRFEKIWMHDDHGEGER